jgi:hypothetical protein
MPNGTTVMFDENESPSARARRYERDSTTATYENSAGQKVDVRKMSVASRDILSSVAHADEQTMSADELFDIVDVDKSGSISRDEFARLWKDFGLQMRAEHKKEAVLENRSTEAEKKTATALAAKALAQRRARVRYRRHRAAAASRFLHARV